MREWLPPALGLDRYGGLLEGPNFDATGFFRTERRDGRWWLVTPHGHGFFSLGVDVVRPDVGATFVEGREFMFAGLPEPGDPLAAHYGYADERSGLPAQRGRQYDHGRSFDFLPPIGSGNTGQTTCRSGAARRSSGCGLGLQYDRQLERAPVARASRDALCRADPRIRKFREG